MTSDAKKHYNGLIIEFISVNSLREEFNEETNKAQDNFCNLLTSIPTTHTVICDDFYSSTIIFLCMYKICKHYIKYTL